MRVGLALALATWAASAVHFMDLRMRELGLKQPSGDWCVCSLSARFAAVYFWLGCSGSSRRPGAPTL